MSLTQNILQSLSVQPPPLHWLCVTHTFHIPVDVSGRPARQLIVTHASQKDGSPASVCWSNPDFRLFSQWPLFTHSVNVHIYKQFIVLPGESSGTSKREETQTSEPSGSFFPSTFSNGYQSPYPVRSFWFENMHLKTPGLALYKRRFVPQSTATLSAV